MVLGNLFRSDHLYDLKINNDRGHYEMIQVYLYLYKYRHQFFLTIGSNDEHQTKSLSRLKLIENKIELKFNYDTQVFSEGTMFGDYDAHFCIDFSVEWHEIIFKRADFEYQIRSLGMVALKSKKKGFKAQFYNCFGDVLFEECHYDLIYEGNP
ncbi:hypothetical protein [Croceiramulus getboli]|nr:hypothetical protein P8624_06610 [Flavobacteriaceae bacterium YJPT1-3]